jgi:hypothetical protein
MFITRKGEEEAMSRDLSDYAPEDLLWRPWDCNGALCWDAYAIRKRTARFVHVSRYPIGIPRDRGAVRLDRAKLEAEGFLDSPRHYGTLYTTAAKQARTPELRRAYAARFRHEVLDELRIDRRVFELGPQLDFAEVAPGIYKAAGFEVYAQAVLFESCPRCGGSGEGGPRGRCRCCFGGGKAPVPTDWAAVPALAAGGFAADETIALDLDDTRRQIASSSIGLASPPLVPDRPTLVLVSRIGELRNAHVTEGADP